MIRQNAPFTPWLYARCMDALTTTGQHTRRAVERAYEEWQRGAPMERCTYGRDIGAMNECDCLAHQVYRLRWYFDVVLDKLNRGEIVDYDDRNTM